MKKQWLKIRSKIYTNRSVALTPLSSASPIRSIKIPCNFPQTRNCNDDLKNISVPTLIVTSKHNTFDQERAEWMAEQIPDGEFLYCPNGSHVMMYDDAEVFFEGVISFIKRVDRNSKNR